MDDANAPGAIVDIESKIPGTAGTFSIIITEANFGASTITVFNPATGMSDRVIRIDLDNDPNPTAGGIVDLINGDAVARTIVTANVRNDANLAGPGEAEDTDGDLCGVYDILDCIRRSH